MLRANWVGDGGVLRANWVGMGECCAPTHHLINKTKQQATPHTHTQPLTLRAIRPPPHTHTHARTVLFARSLP